MPPRRRDNLITYLVVGPFAIVLAFPFYWMLQTSLKSELDLYNTENIPFSFGDGSPTLDNYRFLFSDTQYLHWLLNTVLVGLVVGRSRSPSRFRPATRSRGSRAAGARASASASSSSTSCLRRCSSCRCPA